MNAKSGARERFDAARDSLIALSHRIHANPELGFEEEKASMWLSEALSDAGFAVETNITGEKVVNHPRTQLIDASLASYRILADEPLNHPVAEEKGG